MNPLISHKNLINWFLEAINVDQFLTVLNVKFYSFKKKLKTQRIL